uniref:Uncharacterized protein n=1 Tax=Ulva partita TaxID=1605170 RepID=A0A1C9ZW85_9CHLO|nr:hypothetical protein [Ulva partita]
MVTDVMLIFATLESCIRAERAVRGSVQESLVSQVRLMSCVCACDSAKQLQVSLSQTRVT